MMKAVCYTRVSTTEQATEGFSLAAQEESARAYCKAQGWELTAVYADAKSGSSMTGRGELARLLVDAAAGEFERVICWKLDRLGRNLRDLLDISDQLEQAGVGVVSIQESLDTRTAAGRMMRSILGSLAEFERETIVERIVAGIQQKAREGDLVGPLPLGYRRDGDEGVVADEAKAALVRDTFERYATGRYSLRELARWTTSIGLLTSAGNPYDRLSVRKLLTCVTYAGKVAFHARQGGDVVDGQHPAIVTIELFEKVQRTLGSRRRNKAQKNFGREPYPLSGVTICGVCSAPLVGTATTVQQRWRYRYYRCSTSHRRGKGACRQPMIKADVLEGHLGAYVSRMRLPPEYLGEVVDELRRRHQATRPAGEEKAIEGRIERWRRLFVLDEIGEERYHAEVRPLKQQLDEVQQPTEVLDIERAVLYLRDVGALWAESPREQQREFVGQVFTSLEVKGDELVSITPAAQYAPLFVVDRHDRFAGDFCSLAPRAGLEPAT